MFVNLFNRTTQAVITGVQMLRRQVSSWTKPTNRPLVHGTLRDLVRTKPQLITENALLRQ
ncbi:MAG: hypothetical protein M3R24_30700 [Chloroflexota bacterium]|nr:hypothetical protein [Chloroflexota bacterium]PLS78855.1 MAG: hypothetical protein CYG59_16255 [Chloroflexota bacterium]